jgi:YD repeat-containing protein
VAGTGSFSGNPVRVQTFGYDANARLTSERNYKGAQLAAFLGNPAAAATETTAYTYDNVGNRTAKTVTTATGSTVIAPYSRDGSGNLASKSSPGEYTG